MALKINSVVSIGIAIGSIIRKNTVKCPPPSMNAASAYSQETALKKAYTIKNSKPHAPAPAVKNTAKRLSYNPRSARSFTPADILPTMGSVMAKIATEYIKPRALNLYLLRTYPVADTNNICSTPFTAIKYKLLKSIPGNVMP